MVGKNGIRAADVAQGRFHDLDEIAKVYRERNRSRLNLLFFDLAMAQTSASEEKGFKDLEASDFPSAVTCTAVGTRSGLAEAVSRYVPAEDTALSTTMRKIGDAVEIDVRFGVERDGRTIVVPSKKTPMATSRQPQPDPEAGDEWINGLGMVFCWIPPGSFRMGIEGGLTSETRDARPVDVKISRGFWMSKYELTNRDLKRLGKGPSGEVLTADANVPVTMIKGPSARDLAAKLLMKEGETSGRVPDGWSYRLPTEAEWEYACRAGSDTAFGFGDEENRLHEYANYADARLHEADDLYHYADRKGDDGIGERPAAVGSYKPNAWGLHDMHGNVSEWCLDSYGPELPGGTDPRITSGHTGGGNRVVHRGGAWCSAAAYCRSGFRHSTTFNHNNGHLNYLGLRPVLAPISEADL
ncbi:MAG: formylglycine-generating enzyme family protein, partial [Verrucomicrobiota bacterium]